MKFLSRERLSQHKYKTPEGYLICVDSVLARTGKQTYRRDEVFHDSDDTEIEVDRKPEEVFSEQTLASFENKPITVEHPDCDVTCENYKDYAVGFVRDVKRGTVDGQDVILGTLVIQDAKTIDEIEAGEHVELSCGYDCDIKDEENPQQRNIRGNHVALCEQGRAGNARIVDTAVYDMALSRADAMERCISLGKRFIEHFDKIYKNPNDSSVQHWRGEMKGWLDSVKEIKLKNTSKPLLNTELHDWFFTAGANVGDFIKSPLTDEITAYDKFIVDCLSMGLDSAFKNIKSEVTDSMDFVTGKNLKQGMRVENEHDQVVTIKEIMPKDDYSFTVKYVFEDGKEKVVQVGKNSIWKVADSIKDEISGAYKKWFKLLGDRSNDKNALQKDIVLIMKDRELSYVEADELIKRAKRFIPQQDSVEDETPYEEATKNLNKNVDDAEVKIVPGMKLKNGNEILVVESNDGEYSIVKTSTGKRYRYSTYDLAENLKMSPTWSVIKDSLKKFAVEDAEKTYKIYVKNAFGAYKVADWPAESKEKAVEEFLELNPRYKKIGIVEARDSVSNSSERTDNSLKTFKVQYTKDSETHIHLVKAKTVQDALKKVNDYRDLNDMTNAILQCNKDMASAKDKAVEYLACKSLLEDIVNQADPKVKEHWRQEKDNWLKAMKAKYNV